MILETIKQCAHLRALNPAAYDAISSWLHNNNPATMEPSSFAYIDTTTGIRVKVQSFDTGHFHYENFEAHQAYIDVHIIFVGTECIAHHNVEGLHCNREYDTAKDLAFYTVEAPDYSLLTLSPGSIAIFFPQDAHAPGLKLDESGLVKKVIFKIPISA